jgi:hypothetical protein
MFLQRTGARKVQTAYCEVPEATVAAQDDWLADELSKGSPVCSAPHLKLGMSTMRVAMAPKMNVKSLQHEASVIVIVASLTLYILCGNASVFLAQNAQCAHDGVSSCWH